MKEIISIHIGQAGVQIGNACWKSFCLEQDIQSNGIIQKNDQHQDYININDSFYKLFREINGGLLKARAILVDTEPTVINQFRQGEYSSLFQQSQYIYGMEDAANNFARGYYSVGKQLQDLVLDQLRKQLETCDRIDGFIIYHSLGGGSGSGLGALLTEQLSINQKEAQIVNINILPSPKLSTSTVEQYNAMLSLQYMINNVDINIIMDNEGLYNLCEKKLNILSPNYNSINNLISLGISSLTSSIRLGGHLNTDLFGIQQNLIPYPKLHFLQNSLAPLIVGDQVQFDQISTQQITQDLFKPEFQFAQCNPNHGKYIACNLMFRGDVNQNEILKTLNQIKYQKQSYQTHNKQTKFIEWIPTSFKLCIHQKRPLFIKEINQIQINKQAYMIYNSNSICEVFEKIKLNFNQLFQKKAFLHWFIIEGAEEYQFVEAKEDLFSLQDSYQEYEGDFNDVEEQ